MTDQPGQNSDPTPPDPNVPPPPPPAAPPPAYGAPPPAPGYGTPPPAPGYQQPPAPGYQQPGPIPGYQQPGPMPGYQQQPDPSLSLPFANWGQRVQSALVDWFGPFFVAGIFYAVSHALGTLVWLAALAWAIYNAVLAGQTGQSYGKKMAGTRLVSSTTGQPIGGGMGFGRAVVHILDGLPCYLGYLWPLWDSKRQTFADKIIGTYVLKV